jgi:hypothetical protein
LTDFRIPPAWAPKIGYLSACGGRGKKQVTGGAVVLLEPFHHSQPQGQGSQVKGGRSRRPRGGQAAKGRWPRLVDSSLVVCPPPPCACCCYACAGLPNALPCPCCAVPPSCSTRSTPSSATGTCQRDVLFFVNNCHEDITTFWLRLRCSRGPRTRPRRRSLRWGHSVLSGVPDQPVSSCRVRLRRHAPHILHNIRTC